MKIEIELTWFKASPPKKDGYYLVYTQSKLNGVMSHEEALYTQGNWVDNQGCLIPEDYILYYGCIPECSEIMKN